MADGMLIVVHGCRDLFWLPVEQYRRDGRIVRGFQRGAQSFMTCTAMSTLELTNRVVQTIQVTTSLLYLLLLFGITEWTLNEVFCEVVVGSVHFLKFVHSA